jgi:type IV pilus assembly protein PilM
MPLWACEFTSRHVVVAGVNSSRKRVAGSAAVPLSDGAIAGSLSEKNLRDPGAAAGAAREAIDRAGARGFEISLVIPDESSRVAFLTAENLAGKAGDREAFIRWKLKKTVPFDVDTAQIAYQVLGPHKGAEGKGVDILVALSPRSIVQEYEELLERMNLHAGYVVPSTLAAMNLAVSGAGGAGDVLFLKIAPDSITTTIFQDRRPRFFRRVGEMPLYDAVYPTVMYYQDKLGGRGFANVIVCGYDNELQGQMAELQERMGAPVTGLGPEQVEDIYKPALGAANLA